MKVWHIEATGEPKAGGRDSGWRYSLATSPAQDFGVALWRFDRLLSNGSTVQVECVQCGEHFGNGTSHELVALPSVHISRRGQLALFVHERAGCSRSRYVDHRARAAGEVS